MAHFSSRVEVKGDPKLAAQIQSDMNMGMHMGMPDAKMKVDMGDTKMKFKVGDAKMKVDMGGDAKMKFDMGGDAKVKLNMGMPDMAFHVCSRTSALFHKQIRELHWIESININYLTG